ncbi:enoyl-CoA hydratase/isomerase family protein [Aeromicrobium alkaliterrae]|uniref:Enoyl-CoA hydratase/isomerase family protein n=1 Tax=Aeromicrobium alkaliterrae TaxID=302168 RepID=A0ABN2K818_9ACTN
MSVVEVSVEGRVGAVVLNRPDQMNAISTDLGRALEAAVRDLGGREDVTVITIRGAGGNFCAGGDFGEVQRLRAEGPEALRELFLAFRGACRAVGEIDQPVVAVVEGVAMAGGFELVQAVDIALVRTDARLSDNHVNFGQIPGGGGSQRLARLVGRSRALGHVLSGERLSGAQAEQWGLALHAYPPETFDADVDAFVGRLASRRPDALRGIKSLVRHGLELDLESGLDLELDAVVDHISGEAGEAGVQDFTTKGSKR